MSPLSLTLKEKREIAWRLFHLISILISILEISSSKKLCSHHLHYHLVFQLCYHTNVIEGSVLFYIGLAEEKYLRWEILCICWKIIERLTIFISVKIRKTLWIIYFSGNGSSESSLLSVLRFWAEKRSVFIFLLAQHIFSQSSEPFLCVSLLHFLQV